MLIIVALTLGIALLTALSPRSWAASPLGDYVTEYCGTYEAVGVKDPAKWLECRKEWERLKALEKEMERQQRAERCDPGAPMTDAERRACYQRSMQELREQQRQEAERRRQMELEERRVRALEEAARAQRDAARAQEGQSWGINRPPACTTIWVSPTMSRTICN